MERLTCAIACWLSLACSASATGEPGAELPAGAASAGGGRAGAASAQGGASGSSAGSGLGPGALGGIDAGGGTAGGERGSGGAESSEDCGTLNIIVRDFTPAQPDFENYAFVPPQVRAFEPVTGIVLSELGADGKPAFASDGAAGGQLSLSSADSFRQWYTDVAGVNQRFEVPIQLATHEGDAVVFDAEAFFPIDGLGFGDYLTWGHNFHFTTETRLEFRYQAGQVFTFKGDDDLWLFVDGQLALDLGGIHARIERSLSLDELAARIGLVAGELYRMDIFHAERHIGESHFRIETTIGCIRPAPEPR